MARVVILEAAVLAHLLHHPLPRDPNQKWEREQDAEGYNDTQHIESFEKAGSACVEVQEHVDAGSFQEDDVAKDADCCINAEAADAGKVDTGAHAIKAAVRHGFINWKDIRVAVITEP